LGRYQRAPGETEGETDTKQLLHQLDTIFCWPIV